MHIFIQIENKYLSVKSIVGKILIFLEYFVLLHLTLWGDCSGQCVVTSQLARRLYSGKMENKKIDGGEKKS